MNFANAIRLAFSMLLTLVVATTHADLSASPAQSQSYAKKNTTDDAPIVNLISDNYTYKLRDNFSFRILLSNKSTSSIYIYKFLDWGDSASLSILVKEVKTNKTIPQKINNGDRSPPPASAEEFMELPPGYVYGVSLASDVASLFDKAGNYEVSVLYHSPVPKNFNFGHPIVSSDQGPIVSNSVKITVFN